MIYTIAWIAYHTGIFEALIGLLIVWLFSRLFRQIAFDLIQAWSSWENSKLDLRERRAKLDIATRQAMLEFQCRKNLLRGEVMPREELEHST